MYSMVFVGIVNFFEMDGGPGRWVLLPDGRLPLPEDIAPGAKIDEHNASFFLQCEDILDVSNWWLPSQETQDIAALHIRELRVGAPSTIWISGMDSRSSESFDDSAFESGIIRLRTLNENIRIDRSLAKTIVQLPIRHGTLGSRAIRHSLIAELTVANHTGPITITARPNDGSAEKTIVLREGSQIVLANISRNLGAVSNDPEASHFRLYALLDADRGVDLLPSPTNEEVDALIAARNIPVIDPIHRYIQHLLGTGAVPEGQCIITGCCECLGRGEH